MKNLDKFKLELPKSLIKKTKYNVNLSPFTTYRIGGEAAIFAEPTNFAEVSHLIKLANKFKIETFVLGGGSNLLIADEGVDSLVISLRKYEGITRKNNLVVVKAGENLQKVVRWTISNNLRGFEIFAGIPGTIGGAVAMNAGGTMHTISDNLRNVLIVSKNGEIENLSKDEITFEYRKSSLADSTILEAVFELTEDDSEKILLDKKCILQAKSNNQPNKPSAGSVFKNPEIAAAGKLIDESGLKGLKIGDACVSPKHANFIVNEGKAQAADVVELINVIKNKVKKIHNVELELELKLWNLAA